MAIPILGCLAIVIIITQCATDPCIGQQSCTCNTTWMRCNGTFPKFIPREVTDVELFEVESDIFVTGAFCNATWDNVRNLGITCLSRCNQKFTLENNTFRCLNDLESLKLMIVFLNGFDTGTFLGLDKVTSLDLTGCQRVCSSNLTTALSDNMVLPLLSELILAKVGTIGCSTEIKVDQKFVDMLGIRPLQLLDFSYTNIIFLHPNLHPICDTLKSIDFSYSTFGTRNNIDKSKVCKSLRALNFTGAKSLKAGIPPITNDSILLDGLGQFYLNVNNLYMNDLVSKATCYSFHNNYFSVNKNNITNFEMGGYNFKIFDMEYRFRENHLQRLSLADDGIETIGVNTFHNLTVLREIDLSDNRLSISSKFNTTFQQLFRRNYLLEKLYLSDNGLTYLPYDTFKSNRRLSILDLSGNKFEQITFNITRLMHLKSLDMRNNAIITLNAVSRNTLEKLFKRQQTAKVNKTLDVDLRGNPFTCDCDSLDFIEWFVHSPFFTKKDQYTCQANGHTNLMNEMAITAAKEDCERPKRRRRTIVLASVVPSISICCIIGIIVGVIKQRRRQLRHKRFNDHVRLLQDNCVDFRFLVFLSFSSDVDQFVFEHIFTPLQHHLKTMCQSDKDLVCIGDRYFRPGQTIFSEMIRCLDDSAVFIAVMSKNYCNSDYCKLEIEQARLQGKPIILIFIEEVDEEEMTLVIREVFRKYTRVKFVNHDGIYTLQPDWKCVCESIIHLMD